MSIFSDSWIMREDCCSCDKNESHFKNSHFFFLFLYELCQVYFHCKSLLSHHGGRDLTSFYLWLFFSLLAGSWISKSHFWRAGHSLNLGYGRPKALILQFVRRFSFRCAGIFKPLSFSFVCFFHYLCFPRGGARILYWFCALLGQTQAFPSG